MHYFKNMKKNKVSIISFLLACIGIILTIFLLFIVNQYFELKITMIACVVCLLIWLLLLFLVNKKPKVSAFINLILSVALLVVSVFGVEIAGFTNKISKYGDLDTIKIVAKEDSNIQLDDDFTGMSMAVIEDEDEYTSWALSILKDNNKYPGVSTSEYKNVVSAYEDLNNEKVDLLVLSSDSEEEIKDNDDIENKDYKVLYEDSRYTEVSELPSVDLSDTSFTVLINGVDLSGTDINQKCRADIDILVTVNPKTGKINLQVLPRDLWVEVASRNNEKTKLTRTGSIGGTQCTIDAIEQYFDYKIKINYYVKVNFAGFVDLVDALGGITVDNPHGAYCGKSSYTGQSYCFAAGENTLNGDEALTFARIRKVLSEGDISRGKNQLIIIKAILKKFGENPSLKNFKSILSVMEGNFVTSFDEKDYITLFNIYKDIKDTMSIESNSMQGKFVWDYDPIYNAQLYYFVPDDGEKEAVIERINDTLYDGESNTNIVFSSMNVNALINQVRYTFENLEEIK